MTPPPAGIGLIFFFYVLDDLLLTKFDFWKFWKSRIFFYKIREISNCFCFTIDTKRKCSQLELKIVTKSPKSLAFIYLYIYISRYIASYASGKVNEQSWLTLFKLSFLGSEGGMPATPILFPRSWQFLETIFFGKCIKSLNWIEIKGRSLLRWLGKEKKTNHTLL